MTLIQTLRLMIKNKNKLWDGERLQGDLVSMKTYIMMMFCITGVLTYLKIKSILILPWIVVLLPILLPCMFMIISTYMCFYEEE